MGTLKGDPSLWGVFNSFLFRALKNSHCFVFGGIKGSMGRGGGSRDHKFLLRKSNGGFPFF